MSTQGEEGDNTYTFVLMNEDHTLGATLVDILNKNDQVVFAGYTIPHPSEKKVQLTIRTSGVVAPKEALAAACTSLIDMCQATKQMFKAKVTTFKNAMEE